MKLVPEEVFKVLTEELAARREEVRLANERIAALTQALAHKFNVPLVMPQTPLAEIQHVIQKSPGWFDTQIQVIPSGEKQ